ncbi:MULTISPECIES: hypothetical protein [Methylomonas]|uniref:hypothetical protein n=1 Tax=Methylomonas TaxID=416 RepID=UPI0012320577|nr:hypothetical protein [Methylomonas rhizoryzae]
MKAIIACMLLGGAGLAPGLAQAVPREAGHQDAVVSKLQSMVKKLTAERDAALAAADSLDARLQQTDRELAELKKSKTGLGVELDAQRGAASEYRNRWQSSEGRYKSLADDYEKLSKTKSAREQELAEFMAKQQETAHRLDECGQHNVKLYQAAEELLQRYQNKGTFSGLLQDEPLLQFQQVDMENIRQEYEDRLREGRLSQQSQAEP